MTPFAVRLRSALLCGLFLLGTLGVPLADGAMFHMAGQDPCAGITHVEAQGSTHHADRCTLAQPTASQREDLGSARTGAIALPPSSLVLTPPVAGPRSAARLTPHHSRAPPA